MRADPARKAKETELEAWEQFKDSPPVVMGAKPKEMVDTRWMLTWKEVAGVITAKARLAAKGHQAPDLCNDNVDIAGCVIRRLSHLQLISLGALKKWPIRSLDTKNASLQTDGFDREVYPRAPCAWNFKDNRRFRRLQGPAYGRVDAPVALHQPLRKYSVNSVESSSSVGRRFEVSSLGPRLSLSFAAGAGQLAPLPRILMIFCVAADPICF